MSSDKTLTLRDYWVELKNSLKIFTPPASSDTQDEKKCDQLIAFAFELQQKGFKAVTEWSVASQMVQEMLELSAKYLPNGLPEIIGPETLRFAIEI